MIGDVCVKKVIVVLITIILISLPSGVYARHGCCSYHGGVAFAAFKVATKRKKV